MARYKTIAISPMFLPVVLSEQLLPGIFEHGLNYVPDLRPLDAGYFATIVPRDVGADADAVIDHYDEPIRVLAML